MRYRISLDFPCSSASPLCITPSEPQGTETRLRAKIIHISCITNLLVARKCPNPSYPALFLTGASFHKIPGCHRVAAAPSSGGGTRIWTGLQGKARL